MRPRVAGLDGIRGLALVAVLGYHALPGSFPGGFLGVEIFFVLSGYLLTSLLLSEHARDGAIDHARYGVRRVRRLVPAGLALLAALLLAVPSVAPGDAHRLGGDLLWSLGGLTNWHLIADGSSYFATVGRAPFVRHLWSLGVEIQFCLVCSVLAAWLARRSRKIAVIALGGGIAASALAMGLLYRSPDPSRAYYGTDARLSALLTGALIAVVVTARVVKLAAAAPRWVPGMAALSLTALVLLTDQLARWLYPAGFLLTQAATAVLIVTALGSGMRAAALGARPLRWLGERSYGIYLWHWPLVVLMRPGIRSAIVGVSAACALGGLSYRFVERPAMRAPSLRDMWRSVRDVLPREGKVTAGVAALSIVAAFAGLAARLPTVDPIAESIRAGEEVLAAQLVSPSMAVPAVTEQPAESIEAGRLVSASRPAPLPAPAPLPDLPAFVPGSLTVTALGDSVMVGAAAALHDRLGSSGYIDAAKNRRFSEAAPIATGLREQGRLGRVVVVHLGNNGPVRDEEIEALLREIEGVQQLLLATVRVNKGWEGPVNETLRAAAARHPSTITIVDWYAHSEGHPDWFHGDGTHLRTAGAEAYAHLLTGSIPPPPTPEPTPAPTSRPTPAPTPNPLPLPSLLPPPHTTF